VWGHVTRLVDRVVDVLDGAGIVHALIGAAALAAAGVARSTFDLDFLTTDTRALDERLWVPLRQDEIDIAVRRGDPDDPLAGIVRMSATAERPVDLVVGRFEWQRRAVDRARALPPRLRVVIPRDLILLKLFAGGAQDMWDIRQLLTLDELPELFAEVDADVDALPEDARARWAELREVR
jgi:hypothetical protein